MSVATDGKGECEYFSLIKKRKNTDNKWSAFLMEIMYYEDIEVGQKMVKSLTYQVKKEEIIKFARH